MSSISSARRGRPNKARTEDYVTIEGNFRPTIHKYLETCSVVEPEYKVEISCLSSPEDSDVIFLTDTLELPKDSKIVKGPIGVYRYILMADTRMGLAEIEDRCVAIDNDVTSLDLIAARTATEAEIGQALDYEPPVEAPKPKPQPTFARISRETDRTSSRLGFNVGPEPKKDVVVGDHRWTAIAFHLSSPQIIGALETSLGPCEQASQTLLVKLYDASGNLLLNKHMTKSRIQFDQQALSAGDYIVFWKAPTNCGCYGTGSVRQPLTRTFYTLPETVLLDEILSTTSDVQDETPIIQFKFAAW